MGAVHRVVPSIQFIARCDLRLLLPGQRGIHRKPTRRRVVALFLHVARRRLAPAAIRHPPSAIRHPLLKS